MAGEDLNAQLEETKKQLAKVEYDLGETTSELEMRIENIKDLEREKEFLQMRLQGAERESHKVKQEAASGSSKKVTEMEKQISTLKTEGSKLKNEISKLKNMIEDANAENAKLRSDALQQSGDLESKIRGFQEEEERVRCRVENMCTENVELKKEMSEMKKLHEEEIEQKKMQIDELCRENQNLKSEISKLQEEEDRMKGQIDELCVENGKMKRDTEHAAVGMKDLEKEMCGLQEECKILKDEILQLKSINAENSVAVRECDDLKIQLEALNEEMLQMKKINAENSVTSRECDGLKEDLKKVSEKGEQLKSQIEILGRENEELKKQNAVLCNERDEIQKELQTKDEVKVSRELEIDHNDSNSKEKLSLLEEMLNETKVENKALRDAIKEKDRVIQQLQSKIQSMNEGAHRSWIATVVESVFGKKMSK